MKILKQLKGFCSFASSKRKIFHGLEERIRTESSGLPNLSDLADCGLSFRLDRIESHREVVC